MNDAVDRKAYMNDERISSTSGIGQQSCYEVKRIYSAGYVGTNTLTVRVNAFTQAAPNAPNKKR